MTRIWLLYQGILFILVIILLPIGVGGAIAALSSGRVRKWDLGSRPLVGGLLLLFAGTTLISELAYRFFQASSVKETLDIFGLPIAVTSISAWIFGSVAASIGLIIVLKGERRIREFGERAANAMTKTVLQTAQLKKAFGPIEIIRGVDLEVCEGERHALIGPYGAGKSTMFELLSASIAPTSGDILLRTIDLRALRRI